jgi:hypothetical protein
MTSAFRLALWRTAARLLGGLWRRTGLGLVLAAASYAAWRVEAIERPLRDRTHARELAAAISCDPRGGQR